MKSIFSFWFDGSKWWIAGAGQVKFWIGVRTSVIKLPTKYVFNVVRKSKITKASLYEIMFIPKLCRALTMLHDTLTPHSLLLLLFFNFVDRLIFYEARNWAS